MLRYHWQQPGAHKSGQTNHERFLIRTHSLIFQIAALPFRLFPNFPQPPVNIVLTAKLDARRYGGFKKKYKKYAN